MLKLGILEKTDDLAWSFKYMYKECLTYQWTLPNIKVVVVELQVFRTSHSGHAMFYCIVDYLQLSVIYDVIYGHYNTSTGSFRLFTSPPKKFEAIFVYPKSNFLKLYLFCHLPYLKNIRKSWTYFCIKSYR